MDRVTGVRHVHVAEVAPREPGVLHLVPSSMSVAPGPRIGALLALITITWMPMGCGGPEATPDPDLATIHDAYLEQQEGALLVMSMSRVDPSSHYADPLPPRDIRAASDVRTPADYSRVAVLRVLEDLREETWYALVAANAQPTDLSKIVRFSGTIHWLSEEDMDRAFSDGEDLDACYDRLFKLHPGADQLLGLSMPGISEDGTQALLYVDSVSGGEAGSGTYYLLVREGDIWRIVAQHMAWIA